MKTYVSPAKHFTIAALALITASAAHAQSLTWNGTGGNWSTGTNWVGGVAPSNPATAPGIMTFGNTGSGSGSNVDVAWQVSRLSFTNTSGTWNITGSALTLADAVPIAASGVGNATIANNLTLSAAGSVRVTASSTGILTLNGTVTMGATSTILVGTGGGAGTQNIVINGQIVEPGTSVAVNPNGNWTLANAANNFTGNISIGSAGNSTSTLTVKSLSDSGVASAIGRGSVIGFYGAGASGNITQTLIVDSASGGSTNRTIDLRSASATIPLIGRIVSNVAGQTATFSGNFINSSGVAQTAHLALDGVGNGAIGGTIEDIGVRFFPCFRCLNIGNNMSRRWRALFWALSLLYYSDF